MKKSLIALSLLGALFFAQAARPSDSSNKLYCQIALTDEGYFRQCSLAPFKNDGSDIKTIEEKTTRPWGAWLGLGYVDLRSAEKKGWSRGAKYAAGAAAAGLAIYGGYKGVKYLGSEGYDKSQFGQTGFGKSVGGYARGTLSTGSNLWNKGGEIARGAYGSISNYFTKPEQRRLEHIDKQREDIKEEILESGEKISGIQQQKEVIIQDPTLPVEQKDKKIKEFDKEASQLSAQIETKEKEIETLAQKEENIAKKAATRVAKTTRVPAATRVGRTAKAKRGSSPVVIADEKTYLGTIKAGHKADDKRIKRLNRRSAAMEDLGGYSEGVSFAPALRETKTGLQQRNANRRQQRAEQEVLRQEASKKRRPLTLPEYEQKIRQQAIDEKYNPWYKRIFNR